MAILNNKFPFKVTHVLDEYTSSAGGLPAVVSQIARRTAKAGVKVEIVCTKQDSLSVPEGVSLTKISPSSIGGIWGWSRELVAALEKILTAEQTQIVHLHGVWKASQWIAAKIAKRRNIPIVLTEHGMLDPWLWDYKGKLHLWKKKIY